MLGLFRRIRKSRQKLAAMIALGLLAACDGGFGQLADGGPISDSGEVKVALLVPYGSSTPGDDALARNLENAARLAAADLQGQVVTIKVYPTGGSAAGATRAADAATAEGASVILGPLRSDAANAAAVAARDDGVNVLAFSNNSAIAGGNLLLLGNTFDNVAARVLGYARATGRSNVAVIHAQTPVGQIAKAAVERAAATQGMQLVDAGSYEFTQEGIASALPGIAERVSASGASAVMLTSDSAGALPILAQLLPQSGLPPSQVKYLGLARWDIPPQTLSYPALQGGWFAVPDPNLAAQFSARYTSAYGSAPHPLAGLAYDGIAAIGALAAEDRALSGSNFRQGSGFRGVNGVFRFTTRGTVQRALAIAQVTDRQVQIIDPAPTSFGAGG